MLIVLFNDPAAEVGYQVLPFCRHLFMHLIRPVLMAQHALPGMDEPRPAAVVCMQSAQGLPAHTTIRTVQRSASPSSAIDMHYLKIRTRPGQITHMARQHYAQGIPLIHQLMLGKHCLGHMLPYLAHKFSVRHCYSNREMNKNQGF